MPTCDPFYKALIDCLYKSPCVVEARKTPRECLDPRYKEDMVSEECRLAQRAYLECKMAIMNPRKRFRGPYGGRPAPSASPEDDENS